MLVEEMVQIITFHVMDIETMEQVAEYKGRM